MQEEENEKTIIREPYREDFLIGSIILIVSGFFVLIVSRNADEDQIGALWLLSAILILFGVLIIASTYGTEIEYDNDGLRYRKFFIIKGSYAYDDLIVTYETSENFKYGYFSNKVKLYDKNHRHLVSFDMGDSLEWTKLHCKLISKCRYKDLDYYGNGITFYDGDSTSESSERTALINDRDKVVKTFLVVSPIVFLISLAPIVLPMRWSSWLLLMTLFLFCGLQISYGDILFGNAHSGDKNVWTLLGEPQNKLLFTVIIISDAALILSLFLFSPASKYLMLTSNSEESWAPLAVLGLTLLLNRTVCNSGVGRIIIAFVISAVLVLASYDHVEYVFSSSCSFPAIVQDTYIIDDNYLVLSAEEIRSEVRENKKFMSEKYLYKYECGRNDEGLPRNMISIPVSDEIFSSYNYGDTINVELRKDLIGEAMFICID